MVQIKEKYEAFGKKFSLIRDIFLNIKKTKIKKIIGKKYSNFLNAKSNFDF